MGERLSWTLYCPVNIACKEFLLQLISFLQYFITYAQKHPDTFSFLSENLLSQIYNFIRYIFYLPNYYVQYLFANCLLLYNMLPFSQPLKTTFISFQASPIVSLPIFQTHPLPSPKANGIYFEFLFQQHFYFYVSIFLSVRLFCFIFC